MKFGVMFQFISVFLLLYVFVGIQVQPCPRGPALQMWFLVGGELCGKTRPYEAGSC